MPGPGMELIGKEDFESELASLVQHVSWKKDSATMKQTGRQGAEVFAKELINKLPPRVSSIDVEV